MDAELKQALREVHSGGTRCTHPAATGHLLHEGYITTVGVGMHFELTDKGRQALADEIEAATQKQAQGGVS